MVQQGQVFQLTRCGPDGERLWAYRYRTGGRDSKRVQRGGYASEADARDALERELERLRREARIARRLTLDELVGTYLAQHDVQPVTIEKLRYLLSKATAVFGDRRIGELTPREIAEWRMTLSPGYRFEATQALRQVLQRAVAWGMLDVNPAKVGVDNPTRRRKEQHPFESWAELEAIASAIGPRYGPMILFAAATGLRPAEWIALEKRDVDRDERVVYVRRSFTKRELKHPKTEASMRAVPLQARALDALERIEDANGSPLLFPGERGGYLDIHHFRPFQWRPAQEAVGITPLRRVYDLRHTFATFALRAGISTFDLSRYMGASLTMIDRHYGHLARDGREHAIKLLDALNPVGFANSSGSSSTATQARFGALAVGWRRAACSGRSLISRCGNVLALVSRLARPRRSKELEILVLRHELAMLRRQTRQPRPRRADRALVTALSRSLPRIAWAGFPVKPETLLRWHRQLVARRWTYAHRAPGRPPLETSLRTLILRLGHENPHWGYRRIVGELKGLGITFSATSVRKVLREDGLQPAPEWSHSSWRVFLRVWGKETRFGGAARAGCRSVAPTSRG